MDANESQGEEEELEAEFLLLLLKGAVVASLAKF